MKSNECTKWKLASEIQRGDIVTAYSFKAIVVEVDPIEYEGEIFYILRTDFISGDLKQHRFLGGVLQQGGHISLQVEG
ncbi:hypothetical protein KYK30_31360 [Shinella yambaruensis]|uniref:Uncharacterized protein n=1 Tax=Shinella yambaruensis TaxID=415996 RepID=A0ABQ5ZQP3_9HYPH|nr:hypothetical protein [Shinella yambaruensis]MCJ8029980.1 hypothetical protein [Shinella yambaruensis]MCU7984222.1 hypothetical protein [Shinella yambaruensis]GLR55180.1 hypothetical protein GCM10007923_64020 [Shinella yambaruensis]